MNRYRHSSERLDLSMCRSFAATISVSAAGGW